MKTRLCSCSIRGATSAVCDSIPMSEEEKIRAETMFLSWLSLVLFRSAFCCLLLCLPCPLTPMRLTPLLSLVRLPVSCCPCSFLPMANAPTRFVLPSLVACARISQTDWTVGEDRGGEMCEKKNERCENKTRKLVRATVVDVRQFVMG